MCEKCDRRKIPFLLGFFVCLQESFMLYYIHNLSNTIEFMAAKAKDRTERSVSKKRSKPLLVEGMKDVIPQHSAYWDYVVDNAKQVSLAYGYDHMEVPVVEEEHLYVNTIGEYTDMVQQQLYVFETPDEQAVALRPEYTPGIVRAYVEHNMAELSQPQKFWSMGPVYRYEETAAARYRQFTQFAWNVIGSPHAAVEAEMMFMANQLLKSLGLDVMILVNAAVTPDFADDYIQSVKEHFKKNKKNLNDADQELLKTNPLELFNSTDKACRAIGEDAPMIVDHFSDECREHFMKVLEYLDEADVMYRLQPRLVREQQYTHQTAFECVLASEQEDDAPVSLISGGRFNTMVQDLGGEEGVSGVGMAMGVERVMRAVKEAEIEVTEPEQPEVFFAQIGETARKASLKLFEELRDAGVGVMSNISKNALSEQIQLANKRKAKVTVILGQKEMMDNTIIVRDMENGSQETVSQDKFVTYVKKMLK